MTTPLSLLHISLLSLISKEVKKSIAETSKIHGGQIARLKNAELSKMDLF